MRALSSLPGILVLFALVTGVGAGQEGDLQRVKSESARASQAPLPPGSNFWEDLKAIQNVSAGLHTALRDWLESVLPNSKPALYAALPLLNQRLNADLDRAGLLAPENVQGDFKAGFVNRVDISLSPEDPEKLVAIVRVAVPCGSDDAVYVYDYSQGPPRLVLESHGTRGGDESISDVRFSKRDGTGGQLVLTLRYAVQCGSSWSLLSYDLFRLSSAANAATPILGGQHGIWFGVWDPYQLRLEPNELLMEIRDRSIDGGIHNRAHVLRYDVSGSAAVRVDPVALQPQDFVDEWLTRPWTEMELRSSADARKDLKKWHEFFAGDFVAGEFSIVQACTARPDHWLVGLNLDWIHNTEVPKPLGVYFLVQQSGQYGFKMTDIAFDPQDGCPGESKPSLESPSLFPAHQEK